MAAAAARPAHAGARRLPRRAAARARGGRLGRPDAGRPEIGWCEVELTDDGADDPVCSARCRARFDALQWHHYTYGVPAGAVELARSAACTQAFRLGDACWGVQFHPEVTAAQLEGWIADAGDPPPDPERLRAETREKIGALERPRAPLCARSSTPPSTSPAAARKRWHRIPEHSPGRMVAWLIAAPLVAAAATVLTPEETVEARAGRSGGGKSAPVPLLWTPQSLLCCRKPCLATIHVPRNAKKVTKTAVGMVELLPSTPWNCASGPQIAVTKTATHMAAMASDAHISGTARSTDQLGRSRATGGDPCDIVDMFHTPFQDPFSRQAPPASSGKILTRRPPPATRHTRLVERSRAPRIRR